MTRLKAALALAVDTETQSSLDVLLKTPAHASQDYGPESALFLGKSLCLMDPLDSTILTISTMYRSAHFRRSTKVCAEEQ